MSLWHFSFYFRNSENKVLAINSADLSHIEKFWLLQAHFSETQREDELKSLSENFNIIEKHSLYEASASTNGAKMNGVAGVRRFESKN